jgi:hypothetical protein
VLGSYSGTDNYKIRYHIELVEELFCSCAEPGLAPQRWTEGPEILGVSSMFDM